jgi:hypothetical protein
MQEKGMSGSDMIPRQLSAKLVTAIIPAALLQR